MLSRPYIILAWLGLLILAAYLRFENLDERPIHADEAIGARILAQSLEGNDYKFNPKHFHGPLLALSAQPIAVTKNESTWNDLTKQTLRISPAIAGWIMVLTPLLFRRHIGSLATLAAGAFLATSPLIVYYNRMFIHESLLALLGMIAVAYVYKLTQRPSRTLAITSGIMLGLMFATKETFAISVIAWAIAAATCVLSRGFGKADLSIEDRKYSAYALAAVILAITAFFTATLFYTNGFQAFEGIGDAVKTFFVYETTEGHDKAFNYYLHLLLWPKYVLGMWWSEALVGLLAIASIFTLCKYEHRNEVILFLSVASALHLLIYSIISYKTPWLMLLPWAHVCLLAGIAINSIQRSARALRITCALLILLGLGYQTKQSLRANGRYASDARNPYAYVPTSKDTEVLKSWLSELISEQGTKALNPVAVIGNDYWPLPWYLREFETIGYWPEFDSSVENFPLIFVMPAQNHATAARLIESHTLLPRSLRSQVPVILYLRNDIWKQWTQTTDE